jgi:hypothetical protein
MKSTFLARLSASGVLLMTCAMAAQAQKGAHASPPPQRATPAIKATPAVPEHGSRAQPAVPATPAKPSVKATPKNADKAEDRAEKTAFRRADTQDKALTHGIRLTSVERRDIRAIEKKYAAQFRDLRKSGATVAQIDALRDQERAEIRGVLTASQQTTFDRNAAKFDARR